MDRFKKDRLALARLLAVAGGLVALVGVLVAIFVTGLDFILVIQEEDIEISRTLVGMGWALVGVLGGIMSWTHPRVPGAFMLMAGVAGLVTIPEYFSVGGALLIVGSLMAFSSKIADTAD